MTSTPIEGFWTQHDLDNICVTCYGQTEEDLNRRRTLLQKPPQPEVA